MSVEAAATVKRLKGRLVARDQLSCLYRCDQVGRGIEILITGTGKSAQHALLRWLLSRRSSNQCHKKAKVAIFGFAGSLVPEIKYGDVHWFSDCGIEQVADPIRSSYCMDASVVLSGKLLTVPSVIASLDQRTHLQQRTGAIAVDMESYWLFKVLEEEQLEFGCCRIISDDLTEDIPACVIPLLEAPSRITQALLACRVAWKDRQAARWLMKMYRRSKILSSKLADEAEAFCTASI